MKINLLILLLSSICWAKNITVLEIDTGVDLSHSEIKEHIIMQDEVANTDNWGHGTHIAGLILKDVCPEVKLISCRYFPQIEAMETSNKCFEQALKLHVDFINYSSGGTATNEKERRLLLKLQQKGVTLLVAAGNNGRENPDYYPAKYGFKNMIIVGNLDETGQRHYTSNYGYKRMVWEMGTDIKSTLPNGEFGYMTGTSQATAIHLNKLLKRLCLRK